MSLDTARAVATLRGLSAKFDLGVEAAAPFYPTVATMLQSQGSDEAYAMLGAMPGVREWLGDRQFQSLRAAQFTIANRLWETSVSVEKTDIEDDRLGMYGPILQDLGDEAAHHPDELLFSLIMTGESKTCFDGQYFFDTDHAWGDSGTQSNSLTYAAATGTTPTEAEFRAAYHQARAAMLGFKRDNGKYFIRPTVRPFKNLVLVVPASLEEVANQAINKTFVNGGETAIVLDKPTIVASPLMTDATKFDLYEVGRALKPFVFQARRPLQRQMKGLDDNEFKNVKFMADARYNCGYLAWWYAVRTTFT